MLFGTHDTDKSSACHDQAIKKTASFGLQKGVVDSLTMRFADF